MTINVALSFLFYIFGATQTINKNDQQVKYLPFFCQPKNKKQKICQMQCACGEWGNPALFIAHMFNFWWNYIVIENSLKLSNTLLNDVFYLTLTHIILPLIYLKNKVPFLPCSKCDVVFYVIWTLLGLGDFLQNWY
jgi:hypothetical protein